VSCHLDLIGLIAAEDSVAKNGVLSLEDLDNACHVVRTMVRGYGGRAIVAAMLCPHIPVPPFLGQSFVEFCNIAEVYHRLMVVTSS
jgi:hypothetical protein